MPSRPNCKVLFATVLAVGAAALCVAATPGAGPANWVGDLSPIAATDWNYDRAAHLLERAGFGGTPEEIEALAALSPQDAVRRLVRYQDVKDTDLPDFVETGIYPAPNWTRKDNVAAFAAIVVGRFDKLTPDQQASLMEDAKTGVLPEDKRIAKTAKQAVVDKFYYLAVADAREATRLEKELREVLHLILSAPEYQLS